MPEPKYVVCTINAVVALHDVTYVAEIAHQVQYKLPETRYTSSEGMGSMAETERLD